MPAVTKAGDSTSGMCNMGEDCCPHGRNGTNSNGSGNVFVNGQPLHRQGDSGSCNCPHGGNFSSNSGSGTVFCNGMAVTRVGDDTSCNGCGQSGQHTSGSGNVFAN